MRWGAVLGTLAATGLLLTPPGPTTVAPASPAAASPTTVSPTTVSPTAGSPTAVIAPAVSPAASPAVVAPTPPGPATSCPDQLAPPGPPAEEELVGTAPAALPVPEAPVGGPALGCGELAATTVPLPPIGAASYVLADLDSGAILATRAPHARHRPASTLKVLTALVALRDLELTTVVDGTPEDLRIDGSKAGIGPGGRYTVHELLSGLLLNSGNDTAQALARALGGDAAMVTAMTGLAGELGALDTRPATPSGLDGPGMASSAYDLALLYRVAMRDPEFAAVIASPSVPFPGYDVEHPAFTLYNSSRLLPGYPGSLGSKSGFTDAARHTVVTAAQRDGRRLVVAMMRGEQTPVPMWKQAAALLDWGFAQPAGVAPVGVLVDHAPPPPEPAPSAQPSADPDDPAAPEPAGSTGSPLILVLVGAALVATGAALLVLRRRAAAAGPVDPAPLPHPVEPTGQTDPAAPSDAGASDTAPSDTGASDAAPSDTGASDAAPSDTGASDAAPSDSGAASGSG